MATGNKPLTELKCRDCLHNKLTGWWDPIRVCEIGGFPVDKDGPACISVLPKNTKHNGKTRD